MSQWILWKEQLCVRKLGRGLYLLWRLLKEVSYLKLQDIYMKKLACGPKAKNFIDLTANVQKNIELTA